MKKLVLLITVLLLSSISYAQNTVHAKGVGLNRNEALQDALRAAVSQSSGVVLESYTQVENFNVLKDVVNSQTTGVVTKYDISKETPLASTYEIEIDAVVSQEAIKKNADALQFLVGGIRFLVLYDPRKFDSEITSFLDYTVERINEYLISKEYRYIENDLAKELREPAIKLLGSDTSTTKFVETVGRYADAQFVIYIKNLKIRQQGGGTKATIEIKAYDNCQSEGLGTIEMEGNFSTIADKRSAVEQSTVNAISQKFDRLLMFFNTSIGKWANNGAPYLVRIFNAGGYEDFMDMKNKMKADPDFGGAVEFNTSENFVSFRFKFKKPPDEVADKIIMLSREDPKLKDKGIVIKHFYQRHIYFGVKNVTIAEVDNTKTVQAGAGKGLPSDDVIKNQK